MLSSMVTISMTEISELQNRTLYLRIGVLEYVPHVQGVIRNRTGTTLKNPLSMEGAL